MADRQNGNEVDTPEQRKSAHGDTIETMSTNGAGLATHALVDDVDTGLTETQREAANEGEPKRRRFDLEADALGPEQPIIEEPTEAFTIDCGKPNPLHWFQVDPRGGRSLTITMVKAIPPGGKQERLYYVAKDARSIPELKTRIRLYTLHVIRVRAGHTERTALWPRRQARDFANGSRDVWGATDAKVAETATQQWIRRETDPDTTAGFRAVKLRPNDEPLPAPQWDDRPLAELMELGIPEEDTIRDERHPIVRFLRFGRL
jgi:hypothetical protein